MKSHTRPNEASSGDDLILVFIYLAKKKKIALMRCTVWEDTLSYNISCDTVDRKYVLSVVWRRP
jgi:hypothetical protein